MKIISEQTLANSLKIRVVDQSRRIAADRWYVKVVCEVRMSLADEHFEQMRRREKDGERFSSIRRLLGDEVSMELVRKRNFIDAALLDEVRQDLLAGINENIRGYLAADSFPARLLAIRYGEARKTRGVGTALLNDEREDGDDDSPADFSACFRD